MSSFYPAPKVVPPGLETAVFHLTPLKPTHVQIDYEAVMESKHTLRLWGGHGWPTDNFTADDNLKDLAWHWQEHQERIAFTFTVLSPDQSRCLGCVYIKSAAELIAHNQLNVQPTDALVRFWGRDGTDIESDLLNALCTWFQEAWEFTAVYFHTPQQHLQQAQLFEQSSLTFKQTFALPERGGAHLLYQFEQKGTV